MRARLKGQRGGVAILIALGFLVFSVPLITGSLGLAQTINIDARVKAEITQSDYCGLAVQEFIKYMLSPAVRWEVWLDSDEGGGGFAETNPINSEELELCGELVDELITLEVFKVSQAFLEGDDDGLGDIPDDTAFSQRDFQVTKTAWPLDSELKPVEFKDGEDVVFEPGLPVEYTITVTNRADTDRNLAGIQDKLPGIFSYHESGECDTFSELTLRAETIPMLPNSCDPDSKGYLTWEIEDSPSIAPQEKVTLTFVADTEAVPGTYCNEARVDPGQQQTSSGQTAVVVFEDGGPIDACEGQAVLVTQVLEGEPVPKDGKFFIKYTIEVENIGMVDLTITRITDLLPKSFDWNRPLCGDPDDRCVSDPPDPNYSGDRTKLIWNFKDLELDAGSVRTVKFEVWSSNSGSGRLYVDAIVDFGNGAFKKEGGVYSWPTAPVILQTIYLVTATNADGTVAVFEVVVESKNGEITNWTIIT